MKLGTIIRVRQGNGLLMFPNILVGIMISSPVQSEAMMAMAGPGSHVLLGLTSLGAVSSVPTHPGMDSPREMPSWSAVLR